MKTHPVTGKIRLSAKERSELMTLRHIPKAYINAGLISAKSVTITLPQHEVVRYLTTLNLDIAHGYQVYWNHTPETLANLGDFAPITIVVREFNNFLLTAPLLNAVIVGA
jgi:hypothetical protein